MADSQSQLGYAGGDPTAKITGLMVVGAVVALFFLRKLNVSVAVGK